MRRERPACVAGFGGYPALPAMIAAKALKIPCLIHEQNGVLGRVNRFFAPRVDVVACGTWPTALPPGTRHRHVGNPVRAAVLARHGATYVEPGDWPMGLLVIGGSQGAGLFGRVRPRGAQRMLHPDLRALLRLAQQVRPEDMDRVRAAYEDMGLAGRAPVVLRGRAGAAGRGDAGDQPRRRQLDRRHQRDRPAGDPDPLRARHRRPSGRERPRPWSSPAAPS